MFLRSKTLFAFAVTLTIAAPLSATPLTAVHAGERIHRSHGHSIHAADSRWSFDGGGRHRGNHRPREIDTYSGDVAIYSRRGVGQWSYGTIGVPASLEREMMHPNAKILDLTSGKNACSMEVGVCVIRP